MRTYVPKKYTIRVIIAKPSILIRFRKMNSDKPFHKRIKPFNFILIGSQINDVIPSLPFTKDTKGIQYREFIDYRSGKSSNKLSLPSTAYWKSLEDILTRYVRHNDHKFEYIDGIAHRKHIIADRVRYIGKESNNLEEVNIFGVEEDSILEYDDRNEFYEWVLTLKPKDIKDLCISRGALWDVKERIRKGKTLNSRTKVVRIILEFHDSKRK